MPDVFSALANPTRRGILAELRERPQTVTELVAQFELGRPAVSEHLQVLRAAGLVHDERVGQHRVYHLDAGPLAEASDWLHPFERYWRDRLRGLRAALDEANANPGAPGIPTPKEHE